MACIFKRGKTWSYSVDIGRDLSGKRRKKLKGGFRTQAEAKKAAAIVEAEVAQEIFVDEKRITFADYADKWLDLYKNTVKISTFDLRYYHCRILKQSLGQFRLAKIDAAMYQQLLTSLMEKNYAPKTLIDIHRTLSLIFKSACQNKIIKHNPAQDIVMPRFDNGIYKADEQSELPKYLEKDELLLFLQTIQENADLESYTLFTLLTYTGMRIGELMGLQWKDINLTDNELAVNRTAYIKTNVTDYLLLTPKTHSSKRKITFSENVGSLLRKHLASQRKQRMLLADKWHSGDFVFTSPTYPGYPLPKQTIQNRMKKYLQMAGLNTPVTPHSLRHTHASLLAEAGVSLEAIMERLGHINDNITRRIYLHITKQTKQDVALKFNSLLENA